MSDERYDRSADMRLLELRREALGLPPRVIHSVSINELEQVATTTALKDEAESYLQSGTVLIAAISAQPHAALIPGALVTVSVSVANDGDAAARSVWISLPLPLETAYRPNTLSIDGAEGSDNVAHELFENGTDLGTIEPGARRTLAVKFIIEAGTSDVILSPHLSAASGAILGLRAMRLTRKVPSIHGLTLERPFYESDAAEHANEPLMPATPQSTIAVLQPREYPPVFQTSSAATALTPPPAERVADAASEEPVIKPTPEPVAKPAARPVLKLLVERDVRSERAPSVKDGAEPVAIELVEAVRQPRAPAVTAPVLALPDVNQAVEPIAKAMTEAVTKRAADITKAVAEIIAKHATPLTHAVAAPVSKTASQPLAEIVIETAPKRAKPSVAASTAKVTSKPGKRSVVPSVAEVVTKRTPQPKPKAKAKPPEKLNPKGKKRASVTLKPVTQTIPRPKIEVVRSVDDRVSFTGQGGPMLAVRIDRRRLTTLTGLFSGASLGMIAHYLVLNALAARDPLPGDGTDGSIAAFVGNQEQLLSRALITIRLGKNPSPDSVGATLPAFPPVLATHSDRRAIDAPPRGEAMLFRAFQPAEIMFVKRMLSNEKAAPFMRAAQLFVGLCANDAVIADDHERRRVGVALTAYAALATAEISRIFLRAKLSSASDLFKATDTDLDAAARTVLAAIEHSIG